MCPTVSPARRITGTQLPVLVESPPESPRGLPRSGREVLAPVFTCENDPPRGVDESDAVGETVLDGRLGITALCADAGHEKGEVWDRFADRFEFLVVGATAPEELEAMRETVPDLPFLVPGVGTQGGDAEAAVEYGLADGVGLVNSSRGIIFAGEDRGEDFAAAAGQAAGRLRRRLNEYR